MGIFKCLVTMGIPLHTYLFIQQKTTVQVLMSLDQEMDRVTELFLAHNKKCGFIYAHTYSMLGILYVLCVFVYMCMHAYVCVLLYNYYV